jgi:hypothetical protein
MRYRGDRDTELINKAASNNYSINEPIKGQLITS